MKALDLFCCGGGATKGLQRLGFHVTGVDIVRQPHYCGDAFIQGDALTIDVSGFDFIWASPPCQPFSRLRHLPTSRKHEDLIEPVRAKLKASGIPYAIENVEDAPLGQGEWLTMLCGTMFALRTRDGRAEHRLFETSSPITLRPQCQHGRREALSVTGSGMGAMARTISVVGHSAPAFTRGGVITVTGHTPVDNRRPVICVAGESMNRQDSRYRRRAITVTGSTPQTNIVHNKERHVYSVNDAREAMGIDWLPMRWLSQAIPPVYSEWIARNVLEAA